MTKGPTNLSRVPKSGWPLPLHSMATKPNLANVELSGLIDGGSIDRLLCSLEDGTIEAT
jgi:hypothetical protein